MTLYTRPQLTVLLLVVLVAGIGLGVSHWRRAHPALVDRLERLDRVAAPPQPTVDGLPLAQPARRPAPPKAAPPPGPVDINRATEDELRTLPGIGGVLASRIVEARERDGPFASLEDLQRVRGLGRSKIERLTASIALRPRGFEPSPP
jgi:competence ComEA-like helix-hairpin-helix protein